MGEGLMCHELQWAHVDLRTLIARLLRRFHEKKNWQKHFYSSVIRLHKVLNVRHSRHKVEFFLLGLEGDKNHTGGPLSL